ncbi:hypothetical protein TGMAS_249665 [Toxoplasma gondii MAS]|uniref:Uncharacterized protein n=1 Tax=Toxoplasma gondii MAS TaxID=943118 RepID=A0A086QDW7_TOXGO|nr:hypothetical protein TGMAS_249665 [Toxoplasma gondii MAS]
MTLVHEAQICCFQSLRARQKLSFSTLSRDSQVKEHRLHCNEGADGSPKTKPTSVIRRCALYWTQLNHNVLGAMKKREKPTLRVQVAKRAGIHT